MLRLGYMRLIQVVLWSVILASTPLGVTAASPDEGAIDTIMERYSGPRNPGCSLAVVKDGTVLLRKGYGIADLDHGVPITPATVFHVASVSKQFTAAATYMLERNRKLSTNDSAGQYVKDMPDIISTLKISDLIHHTSGVRDSWQLLILAGWRMYEDPVRRTDVLNLLQRQRTLDFPSGSRFSYSNSGYILLGEVVAGAIGKSLAAYMAENIFGSLHMEHTFFRTDHRQVVPGQAYGYTSDADSWRVSMPNLDVTGATNLMTTADDMALWAANMDHPKSPVDAEILGGMTTSGRTSAGGLVNYGGGLFLSKYRGLSVVEHGGSDAGYRAHFLRFPDQKLTVICLCNTTADAGGLAHRIADVYLDPATPSPDRSQASQNSELELKRYEATFERQTDHRVRSLIVAGNKLRIDVDTILYALQPLGGHRFRNPNQGTTVSVEFDADGKPSRLTEQTTAGDSTTYSRTDPANPKLGDLAEYAGIYRSAELDAAYRVSLDGDHLLLTARKDLREELEPTIRDGFNSGLGHLWWQRDPSGALTGFMLSGDRVAEMWFERVVRDH